jgi:hypothetical protein
MPLLIDTEDAEELAGFSTARPISWYKKDADRKNTASIKRKNMPESTGRKERCMPSLWKIFFIFSIKWFMEVILLPEEHSSGKVRLPLAEDGFRRGERYRVDARDE